MQLKLLNREITALKSYRAALASARIPKGSGKQACKVNQAPQISSADKGPLASILKGWKDALARTNSSAVRSVQPERVDPFDAHFTLEMENACLATEWTAKGNNSIRLGQLVDQDAITKIGPKILLGLIITMLLTGCEIIQPSCKVSCISGKQVIWESSTD